MRVAIVTFDGYNEIDSFVALGLLNRIAPQLNAFSMSFPIKTALTLTLVGSSFALMPQMVINLANHATELVGDVA